MKHSSPLLVFLTPWNNLTIINFMFSTATGHSARRSMFLRTSINKSKVIALLSPQAPRQLVIPTKCFTNWRCWRLTQSTDPSLLVTRLVDCKLIGIFNSTFVNVSELDREDLFSLFEVFLYPYHLPHLPHYPITLITVHYPFTTQWFHYPYHRALPLYHTVISLPLSAFVSLDNA